MVADFSDFYLATSASVNDANCRKAISFITSRYGPKYPASSKNGKLFIADFPDFYLAASASKNGKLFFADFSDFYLVASASVNDANRRKPNSCITPMTRDMGQNIFFDYGLTSR